MSVTAADDPSGSFKFGRNIAACSSLPAETRKPPRELAEFFRSIAPSLANDRDELKQLKKDLKDLNITTALILGEQPGVGRPSDFVRIRGAFSAKGRTRLCRSTRRAW